MEHLQWDKSDISIRGYPVKILYPYCIDLAKIEKEKRVLALESYYTET